MSTAAMQNLWNYIQGLNLSARNRNWLGERLIESAQQAKPRKRLFDPETGEYLNDETIQAIEDAHQGKGIVFCGSFEEYLKSVKD